MGGGVTGFSSMQSEKGFLKKGGHILRIGEGQTASFVKAHFASGFLLLRRVNIESGGSIFSENQLLARRRGGTGKRSKIGKWVLPRKTSESSGRKGNSQPDQPTWIC